MRIIRGRVRRRLRRLWRRRWGAICLGACAALLLVTAVIIPWGCSARAPIMRPIPVEGRIIRVRLFQGTQGLPLAASVPPVYYSASNPAQTQLNMPANAALPLHLAPDGWRLGAAHLGNGELVIRPTRVGSLSVGGQTYRGEFRFIPLSGGRYDVVNHVDLDDYLQSVLSRELLPNWHEETYRAQAIAARTYALFERYQQREARYWDVYPDERSQVYGGIAAETPRSRQAVIDTAGIVLAYGPPGQERIFKAYFSSCCGGVGQSNSDAFNEPFVPPLAAKNVGSLCSIAPRFNWGPVVVGTDELTRRFRAWGESRNRAERDMARIVSIVPSHQVYNRPVRFIVTDAHGARYSLSGEELRWAANSQGTILFSSFIESIVVDRDRVIFAGGHGHGHGVGMCQWCAEARARNGERHEQIVLAAYPGARLVRAY
jgi:stage II sporulation protein D